MIMKYQAQKISENHYVLPKTGDMKCDVHAFLSEELYASSEEEAWKQIANTASYEGVVGAYMMPDAHTGFGIPIGSVVVTDGTILQAGSGYDISCGVLCLKADLGAGAVKSKYERRRWITEIEKRIATGKGHDRPKLMPKFSKDQGEEILRFGAKALGVDASLCERQYIPIDEGVDLTTIEKAHKSVLTQLGSVGGGNHFVEMQVDRDTGEVFIMVHCGSRGYGWQTANHFFYEGAKARGIPTRRREESWVRIDEPVGKAYWAHHNSAANFAVANRHIIVNGVREATQEVFNADVSVYYEISHNLVQEETITLPDGTTKKGFVHRKGATRAFPAGHPDLAGTSWEKTGHPCLIPGSMFEGAAILFPEAGASKTGYSVNHGSGRIMARGEAKRRLEHKQEFIDDEMNTVQRVFAGTPIEGVMGNHRHTPLDECGHVYKDLDAVLAVLEAEGVAKVAHRLYPVANIKGTE
jgi:tRNA-splicing ligase RtcB (3'-phosphate/5'-hydroxy nucleic acid ligase)